MTMKREAKYIATVSLGVMGAGFLATLPTPVSSTIWGTFLQGGFEAGVVGGLADWFAVSALVPSPSRHSDSAYGPIAEESREDYESARLDG